MLGLANSGEDNTNYDSGSEYRYALSTGKGTRFMGLSRQAGPGRFPIQSVSLSSITMKTFNVPIIYRSPLISGIKNKRRQEDKMKKDFTPTLLDFGPLHILVARHFGFCYGVESAIDIAFRTIE